ncbi:hypothetical protein E2L06_14770 [Haloterrigena sp. H1]|uniref:hypothetical protein n=1 Tax=Haloterrigena sp. H1 TaxID=2552943 RepID=UPI00110F5964|nr:hypothetical protein [Haloterrigena sp. H1]TMT87781.1 hypothetical protein E2L06_14770 [Haloterrigena sp. H1]
MCAFPRKTGFRPHRLGAGAADVSVHNLHDEPITISIRAENIEENRTQEDKIPIDETVTLESAQTHTVHNKTRFGSKYTVSVSVNNVYTEEANWTPDSGGGLHVIYDGSENVIFADEFA